MRILLVHDKPANGGGVRVHVEAVRAALADGGHEVGVLRLGSSAEPGSAPPLPPAYWPHQAVLRRRGLMRRIAAFAPDVVHVHGSDRSLSGTLLSAIRRRWPLVVTLHDVGLFCMNGLRIDRASGEPCERVAGLVCRTSGCWSTGRPGAVARDLVHVAAVAGQRRAYVASRRLVVPSAYMGRLASAHGAEERAISVVPNFCEETAEPPPPPDRPPNVLYVGALTRAKGADLALEALASLPPTGWTATFVGDGEERSRLEERATAYGPDRVRFLGWQDRQAVAEHRRRSTVALFPSRVHESFGLSGLESLAAGRPVVGFSRGGAADWLIDGVTGLAAAPDARSLGAALAGLLFDGRRVRDLGGRGQALVRERFSRAAHTAALERIYASGSAAAGAG